MTILALTIIVFCLLLTLAESAAQTVPPDNVFVFYFVFIPSGIEHWKWLVISQLEQLKATGLLEMSSLTVIASTDQSSPTATQDMVSCASAVEEIAGINATFIPRYANRFEYWGLVSIWEKAMSQDIRQREDSVFLYMHSKGMVNHGNISAETREHVDGPLFKYVIEPWREVLFRFKTVPNLHKAGFAITRGGYVYFNYFWVRSSYVARLEAPVERPVDVKGGFAAPMQTVNRFYYEHWISHVIDEPPSAIDGWSMALQEFHLGVFFTLEATKRAFKNITEARLGNPGILNCTIFGRN